MEIIGDKNGDKERDERKEAIGIVRKSKGRIMKGSK